MSVKHIDIVWDMDDFPSIYHKMVLLYIAKIADIRSEGIPSCFVPKVSTIATRCKMSERQARECLRYLSGGVSDENGQPLCNYLEMTTGVGKRKDMYRLHLPEVLTVKYDKKHAHNNSKAYTGYNISKQIIDIADLRAASANGNTPF